MNLQARARLKADMELPGIGPLLRPYHATSKKVDPKRYKAITAEEFSVPLKELHQPNLEKEEVKCYTILAVIHLAKLFEKAGFTRFTNDPERYSISLRSTSGPMKQIIYIESYPTDKMISVVHFVQEK